MTVEAIVSCAHHKLNTSCLNFGSNIPQYPIWLFDNIFHPFLEGGGCVCVKAIPSIAAAVKNARFKSKTYVLRLKPYVFVFRN